MIGHVKWAPSQVEEVDNDSWHKNLRQPRMGVMLHYDGSATDLGSVSWFADPACGVSYQLLVLDDGSYVRIAPDSARAWHAGRCRTSDAKRLPYKDANSAFYGIAAATNSAVGVTPLQQLTVAFLVNRYFELEGWDREELWRIVGHATEAMNKDGTRGRKIDPEGKWDKHPILGVDHIRQLMPLITPTPAKRRGGR